MRTFFVLLLVTAALVVGSSLDAQRGGRGGNGGKRPSKSDIAKWRKGQGGTQGRSDDLKKKGRDAAKGEEKPEDYVGWGEDGDEERIKPGDKTTDKEKDAWIKREAVKLGIDEEKKKFREFKKIAKKALKGSEKEDGRYAKEFKKIKGDDKLSAKSKEKHRKKLGEVWKKADESLTKKEVLDDDQLEEWVKDTADLRKESATDKSARQDEIRQRKIDEIKERLAKYRKGGSGNNGVKKTKKDEDDGDDGE